MTGREEDFQEEDSLEEVDSLAEEEDFQVEEDTLEEDTALQEQDHQVEDGDPHPQQYQQYHKETMGS